MLYIITACALMVAASLYFILNPFFARGKPVVLLAERGLDLETVYEAVNELEMDALMKKISEEDFTLLKESYYRIAAEAIQQKNDVDEEIKIALESIRAGGKAKDPAK